MDETCKRRRPASDQKGKGWRVSAGASLQRKAEEQAALRMTTPFPRTILLAEAVLEAPELEGERLKSIAGRTGFSRYARNGIRARKALFPE